MNDVVIKVENLYKEYRLGTISHGTLYRDLQSWWAKIRGKEDPNSIIGSAQSAKRKASDAMPHALSATPENPHFLALQDVSFEVKRGEVLGIIGRNGAGKSTLLKILSEVTAPTKGKVKIKGRIASLLEVGTGFHPELTGRDNVYLNGAILGMTKKEIDSKFDEIVDFAEIDKFIDTPVKRYSSGMYVRLAFAVAAHLDPEILIIDEVLAVGDAQFQKKCLGKMGEVAKGGRTVLFVSHNMAAIENLCSRCCVLLDGSLIFEGVGNAAIKYYLNSFMQKSQSLSLAERTDRSGNGAIRITAFQIVDESGIPVDQLVTGKDYIFRFHFESHLSKISDIDFGFTVRNLSEQILFRNRTTESGIKLPDTIPEKGCFDCRIRRLPLTSGRYAFGFRLLLNGVESDYITGGYAAFFDVENGDYFGTGKLTEFAPFVVDHEWSIVNISKVMA